MPKALTRTDVVLRLHAHPLHSYALISNVAKGIALSAGGLVLLPILSNLGTNWPRLLPWAASMAVVLLSYVKWARGILLSNGRINLGDSLLPLTVSIIELLLFAVLAVDKDAPHAWLNWPAFLAAHTLVAAALVHNRIRLIDLNRDFTNDGREEDVTMLAVEYREWLAADRREASILGTVVLLAWIVERLWIIPHFRIQIAERFVAVMALLLFASAWIPIRAAAREHARIDELVSNTPRPAVRRMEKASTTERRQQKGA